LKQVAINIYQIGKILKIFFLFKRKCYEN